ncbi:MAG: TonB-dependent receptor [Opitutaceae bacterium]|nr:TonB-dependent receptor [Opitutaceae bacterium]
MRYRLTTTLFMLLAPGALSVAAHAQAAETIDDEPYELPVFTTQAPRVANPEPAATFAMPVSALRFEPLVDVQSRNLAEGQADIALRGGVFEQTGFRVGAVSLFDPQTGHYFAEIPIAPAMLGAPRISTGAANAQLGFNAGAGTVAYGWAPIREGGSLAVTGGPDASNRQAFYEGWVRNLGGEGWQVAADLEAARSESDGPIAYGDHEFGRVGGRLQVRGPRSQTDLFAGYQAKAFGWVNLYTPFNSPESENLQTLLVAINYRADLGEGDFVQAGAYYRRNKDDYAFNRFAPLGPVHPFQHTTWVEGGGVDGRQRLGAVRLVYGAQVMGDELESTSLTAGRYRDRSQVKLSLIPEFTIPAASAVTLRAGATWDDSNRDGGRLSPVAGVELVPAAGATPAVPERIRVEYSEATQLPTYTALNSSATAGLFRGNPNLGRQLSRNLEAGARWHDRQWSVDATLFHRRDEDLVDWTFRQGVTARSANAVDLATTGLELVYTRRAESFDLVFGYTWLDKDADYRGALVDGSFYALNFARHRLTAALVYRIAPGLEVRLDQEFRLQEANPLRRGPDESALAAVALAWRPKAWPGIEVTAMVENLWDSRFEEVPAVPAAPRQYAVGIAWRW